MHRQHKRRKLPPAKMSGEQQHALAARLGPLVVLKIFVDHDLLDVLDRVLRELAQFGELPAQRSEFPAQNALPLRFRFFQETPVRDCACPRAATARAADKPSVPGQCANPRASGRGIRPRILMNGQAAAYSSFRRIEVGRRCRGPRSEAQVLRSDSYFAASCAHFASVVRKEFAAGGGSTSPVSAAFEVIMCP